MSEQAAIGLDNSAFRGRLRRPEAMKLFDDSENDTQSTSRPRVRPTRPKQAIAKQPESLQPIVPVWQLPKSQSNHQQERQQPQQPPLQYQAAPQVVEYYTPQPQELMLQQLPYQETQAPQAVAYRNTASQQTHISQPTMSQSPAFQHVFAPQPQVPRSNNFRRVPAMLPRLHFKSLRIPQLSKLQYGLVGLAAIVFIVGMTASFQTIKTNHAASAAVAALAGKAGNGTGSVPVPSIAKPSPSALSSYEVSPSLPRYIKIPRLGVDARVLQTGLTSTGALGTPDNVYDTAWYTGSAKPGQPGATLIDGHISSWTSKGVFYGLNTLETGDTIEIVNGAGEVFDYQVVRAQVYSADNVDMQSAITSVNPGMPGLNLISCYGNVLKGTSLFDQRIIVYAQENLSVN
jgi:sortase (surface protein transpeptidase)